MTKANRKEARGSRGKAARDNIGEHAGFDTLPIGSAAYPNAYPAAAGRQVPEQRGTSPTSLGQPLGIREVSRLIGLSVWSLRNRLIPQGLPHFRSGPSGRLVFYRNQVIRWVERQQKGGP